MSNRFGYVIAAFVVAGVLGFGVAVLVQQNTKTATTPCTTLEGKRHEFVIANNIVSPARLTATRCDTLTVTNRDKVERIIAFGNHDHHVAYDGIEEQKLAKGQSLTVTLDRVGSFHFHDHLHDEVEGYFTVTK